MDKLIEETAKIFFPPVQCVVCGKELFFGDSIEFFGAKRSERFLCDDCMQQLPKNDGRVCQKCGRALLTDADICRTCRGKDYFYDRAFSCFRYEGSVAGMIRKLKYDDERFLSAFFGDCLAETYRQTGIKADLATYVPMRKMRQLFRGYNQSKLLAARFSAVTAIPLVGTLKKVKTTKHQTRLSGEKRRKNLEGSFAVSNLGVISGANVLLIDDVLTTGSTASEIAKTLLKGGAKSVNILTVASTSEFPEGAK